MSIVPQVPVERIKLEHEHALRNESCHTADAATSDLVGVEHDLKLKLKLTRFCSFNFGLSFSRCSAHEASRAVRLTNSDPNEPKISQIVETAHVVRKGTKEFHSTIHFISRRSSCENGNKYGRPVEAYTR